MVTTTNRRRREESGQHDAQGGTDESPPRERGDRDGCAVDFETDVGRARDGCHDGGADGRDCAGEHTASNETASARTVTATPTVECSHRFAASLRCVARLSRIGIVGDHLGEELVLPVRSVAVGTRDDADHATAAGR